MKRFSWWGKNFGREWRHLHASISTTGKLSEFGLGARINCSWHKIVLHDDNRITSSTSLDIALLWVRIWISIYV